LFRCWYRRRGGCSYRGRRRRRTARRFQFPNPGILGCDLINQELNFLKGFFKLSFYAGRRGLSQGGLKHKQRYTRRSKERLESHDYI